MDITEVKINIIRDQPPLKAFASITINGCFVVHDLRIIKTQGKTFVAMPSKKIKDGNRVGGDSYRDIAHPINAETRSLIETTVLEKYQKALLELKDELEDSKKPS